MSAGDRIPRAEAAAKVAPLLDLLRPAVLGGEVAGSYRREKPMIGDLEMVFIPGDNFHAHLDKLDAQGVISRGRAWGQKQRQFIYDGLKIDLYTATEDNYGYILWLRTGAAEANKRVVTFLKNPINPAPFHLEHGFAWYETNKLHIPDEQKFFRLLGIPFIEPKFREPDTYARLFKSAKTHAWGNPQPLIKVDNAAQEAMFAVAATNEFEVERRGRYMPTPEEFDSAMRLLRARPLPEDAERIGERIEAHQQGFQTTHLGFMRDYHQKQLAVYERMLKEVRRANPLYS